MKFPVESAHNSTQVSHPTRGAWIEIMKDLISDMLSATSHPTRGAWIEIANTVDGEWMPRVAPHTGCVD